jgi:hypothetical protein
MNPQKPTVTAVVAVAAVSLVSGCSSSDSRLIGDWRSNRALTVASFPPQRKLTPDRRASFDGLFGRLTLNYTRRYLYTHLPTKSTEPPFRQRIPYRVLASDAGSVTIALKDSLGGQHTTQQIHFVGPNRYWIPLGTKGAREYFDRLKQ